MKHPAHPTLTAAVLTTMLWLSAGIAMSADVAIECPHDAHPQVALAAKEIRRYIYLRSGQLATISPTATAGSETITLRVDAGIAAEQYRLQTKDHSLAISGGTPLAVLYGAYSFAEKLGVRFYLHGDVVPDARVPFTLPVLDEVHAPLFVTRGIQPFHDFPEGPDWWNQDDYLAYLGQLAKMRMNFIGLHCYPEGGVGPEPLVWIGQPAEVNPDGTVKSAYPSRWRTTAERNGWGYAPMKTSDFSAGASRLFPEDDFGPDVQRALPPAPASSTELFNRVGNQMHVVFAAANQLGVKTCIGTETPLTIPKAVRERLQQQGKNPNDPSVIRELYTGMFQRIAAACPVDYYWLWTPENWTWSGNNPAQFDAIKADIAAALGALDQLGKPFTLATSGWVLGPQHDRAALDAILPAGSPMSCINREVGHAPVEPAFANLTKRPKWAIPWMENDPNMVGYQPWAARMRHDAVDARRFGCTGLLGIHWRTKALAPTVAALAAAAWDQSWVPSSYDTTPVKPIRGEARGGQTAAFQAPVAGTKLIPVYQSVRYGMDGYDLQVPDGSYTVTLHFNEPHYSAAGKRVFGVKVQETKVADRLDLFATAGQNQAHDIRVPDIRVTGGVLHIAFTPVVEFPCIAGITVDGITAATNQLPATPFSRRINCGGPATNGYEADLGDGGASLAYAGLKVPRDQRAMPVRDFYIDFARAHFGEAVANEAGDILASVDGPGSRPNPSDWKGGPGGLFPNPFTADQIQKRFAHVEAFAALRPRVTGANSLAEFDYWLGTLKLNRLFTELGSLRGQLDSSVGQLAKAQSPADKRTMARNALALRIALARKWEEMMTTQVAIVSTPGELGTIANLEQHSRTSLAFLTAHDPALAAALGEPLPPETTPASGYSGPAFVRNLTAMTTVRRGQPLTLQWIALDREPVTSTSVKVRPLGRGEWKTIAATHRARSVWSATLAPAGEDFEYYIEATTAGGQSLRWPPAAPELPQTILTVD